MTCPMETSQVGIEAALVELLQRRVAILLQSCCNTYFSAAHVHRSGYWRQRAPNVSDIRHSKHAVRTHFSHERVPVIGFGRLSTIAYVDPAYCRCRQTLITV